MIHKEEVSNFVVVVVAIVGSVVRKANTVRTQLLTRKLTKCEVAFVCLLAWVLGVVHVCLAQQHRTILHFIRRQLAHVERVGGNGVSHIGCCITAMSSGVVERRYLGQRDVVVFL